MTRGGREEEGASRAERGSESTEHRGLNLLGSDVWGVREADGNALHPTPAPSCAGCAGIRGVRIAVRGGQSAAISARLAQAHSPSPSKSRVRGEGGFLIAACSLLLGNDSSSSSSSSRPVVCCILFRLVFRLGVGVQTAQAQSRPQNQPQIPQPQNWRLGAARL